MAELESVNAAPQPSGTVLTVTLSPVFKLVFIAVLSITILSMFVTCFLVALHNDTDQGKALFELCASICKMGFGAMVGLLGGKAI
jgi:hypothetical protein